MMKILLVNSHTPFLYSLAQTGHEFYCVEDLPGDMVWEAWDSQARPRPENIHSIDYSKLSDLSFDTLILQTPGQWFERWRFPSLPTIYIEHNAQPHLVPHYLTVEGAVVVFVSLRTEKSYVQRPGLTYRTIELGLPDDFFPYEGDKAIVLTVVNKFKEREQWTRFSLWQRVSMGFPIKVIGFGNPGISERAKDWDTLRGEYCHNRVFLSVGIAFPGFADMEAAMTRMPVLRVKGAGQLVQARELLKQYLDDKEFAISDGQKWREWALEYHNIERFCSEWNELLNLVRSSAYI